MTSKKKRLKIKRPRITRDQASPTRIKRAIFATDADWGDALAASQVVGLSRSDFIMAAARYVARGIIRGKVEVVDEPAAPDEVLVDTGKERFHAKITPGEFSTTVHLTPEQFILVPYSITRRIEMATRCFLSDGIDRGEWYLLIPNDDRKFVINILMPEKISR